LVVGEGGAGISGRRGDDLVFPPMEEKQNRRPIVLAVVAIG
jgi:hypothetical protein